MGSEASAGPPAVATGQRDRAVGARRRLLLGTAFYLGLTVLMALILTDTLGALLPAELARRIGYNSEGYILAILLGAWIQFALPRLTARTTWPLAIAAGGLNLAVGVFLYTGSMASQIKTLNEAFFALALVIPYVTLKRPLRRWPPVVSVLVLAAVVIGVATSPADSPVVLLAETMAVFILAPLGFDVFDRAILDPSARDTSVRRWAWYTVLIVVPVVVVLLGTGERSGGGIHAVLEYIGRVHEAVIGLLLVEVYFAVGLRRRGRPTTSAQR